MTRLRYDRQMLERAVFSARVKELGLEQPTFEHKFHLDRKWRIDYSWPRLYLAVELEGAVWVQGRHTRGSGFVKDMEKYNALAECGWTLLRYATGKIDFEQIARVYNNLEALK